MSSSFLSYADAFQAWLERHREQRRAALSRRFLESLPEDIRKDIGWPNENARLEACPQTTLGWQPQVTLNRLVRSN